MDTSAFDVIIIGAGAAGLMCAIEAGKRGRRVMIADHMDKIAEKIRISGGGRCNFTNIHTSPANFLSNNPHFCKSALKQYGVQDFIALVKKHRIKYHEKKLGQLFCDNSAQDIIDMLLEECARANVTIQRRTKIQHIEPSENGFSLETDKGDFTCASLVLATGGLSIPKIGASNFGYEWAKKFGHSIIPPRAGLVPLTFDGALLERCKNFSGLSIEDAAISHGKTIFQEGLLFTHRGLSGPSILQISSYWREGDDIAINLAPGVKISDFIKGEKQSNPKQHINTAIAAILPKRLADAICEDQGCAGPVGGLSNAQIEKLSAAINNWHVKPSGSEGYRTAEVTLGGVDTREVSSKTFESQKQKGLYFVGEVLDVTGHLGGFNFQWAWSSGFAAGQAV